MKQNIIFCFLLSLFISQTIGSAILGDTPIDQACQDHVDCVGKPEVSSECIVREGKSKAKCTCRRDFVPKLDKQDCLPKTKEIGGDCLEPSQCLSGLPGQYSNCVNSKCECTPEGLYIPPVQVCLKKANLIGESCYFTEQCTANLGKNIYCPSEGVCTCSAGFVSSENLLRCLPIVNEIGGNCEESDQCKKGVIGKHSVCTSDSKKCQCNSDGMEIPGSNVCFRKATLIGDNCLHPQQCTENLGELSECSADEKCTCSTGAVGNGAGDNCLAVGIPIGDECEYDAQCLGSSTCSSNPNICACNPASEVPKGDKTDCLPIQYNLNGSCQENPQCQAGFPGRYSACIDNMCKCNNEGIEIPRMPTCFIKATQVGDHCLFPEQCTNLGELSECSTDANACACKIDAIENSDMSKCLLANVIIGNECEEHAQCSGSSTCRSSICACNLAFEVPNEAKSDCLLIQNDLHGECQESLQCQAGSPGRYADCIENMCKCNHEAIQIPRVPMCLRKATQVGDHCLYTEQCTPNLGSLSYCSITNECWITTTDPTTSTRAPTDVPTLPPKEGASCNPHLCKNIGSCQSFLRCDRETETWVAEQCGEEMFWNPDNGTVHGGNCDYHDNISDDVMDGYRADPDCLGCFWKANGECKAGYKYQAPGNRNRIVLDMSCSEGLVFSQEKETCQKCSDVTKSDGSACC